MEVCIRKDGSQKYGTPIYVNVNVPWLFKREPGDWRLDSYGKDTETIRKSSIRCSER